VALREDVFVGALPLADVFSVISAYLCELCVKYFLRLTVNAESTEIRRDRREEADVIRITFRGRSGQRPQYIAFWNSNAASPAFPSATFRRHTSLDFLSFATS